MNKLSTLTLIFTLIITTSISASNFVMITDLGSSARSIALGNVDGYNTSADAVFSNPAALSNVKGYSVSLFSSTLMNDVHYFNAAISAQTSFGTIAVGLYEQSVSNIASTSTSAHIATPVDSYQYKKNDPNIAYPEDVTSKH